MSTKILETFWSTSRLAVVLVENRDVGKEKKTFLAFVVKKPKQAIWALPGNRILRAIELIKIARESESTIEGVQKLWRDMSKDELDSSLNEEQVILLVEWLLESKVHPSLDEIREYILQKDRPDQNLVSLLERLLREGISNQISKIASELNSGKRKPNWSKDRFNILA